MAPTIVPLKNTVSMKYILNLKRKRIRCKGKKTPLPVIKDYLFLAALIRADKRESLRAAVFL